MATGKYGQLSEYACALANCKYGPHFGCCTDLEFNHFGNNLDNVLKANNNFWVDSRKDAIRVLNILLDIMKHFGYSLTAVSPDYNGKYISISDGKCQALGYALYGYLVEECGYTPTRRVLECVGNHIFSEFWRNMHKLGYRFVFKN